MPSEMRCGKTITMVKAYKSLQIFAVLSESYFSSMYILQNFNLRGLDTTGTFSATFCKGDNFCEFLFAFLDTKALLKRDLPQKAKNFFP